MKLEKFLKKNNIALSDGVLPGCQSALKIMENSQDPLHDHHHIYRLLDSLDQLLNNSKEINRQEVNFDILLLAICWHDTWRADKFPHNMLLLIYHTLWEGWGSRILFSLQIKDHQISDHVIIQAKYVIRKHSKIQFIKPTSIEAKILWDLDRLEEWGLARLEVLKKKFLINKSPPHSKFFKIGVFYFKKFMLNIPDTIMNYQWSRREYQLRKEKFLQHIKIYLQDHQHLFNQADTQKILEMLTIPEKAEIKA